LTRAITTAVQSEEVELILWSRGLCILTEIRMKDSIGKNCRVRVRLRLRRRH
jgi:hypothetical protein